MISLQNFKKIPWGIAAMIYGNNHAYLVGLLTHWWILTSPQTRWALESGPSFTCHKQNKKGGLFCDALLCDKNQVLGVLEVEGTRGQYAADKIGIFFGAEPEYYKNLSFGILVLYAYNPKGRGVNRGYPSAKNKETTQTIERVSKTYPNKVIVVVTIDKFFSRQKIGSVRARSEYYTGELSKATGFLYKKGRETDSLIFYEANNVD